MNIQGTDFGLAASAKLAVLLSTGEEGVNAGRLGEEWVEEVPRGDEGLREREGKI